MLRPIFAPRMRRDNQPYLPGMEPEPRIASPSRFERHRLYFAFRPDDAASDAALNVLSNLRRHGATGSAVKRENLHVSLFPLGRWDKIPPDLVEIALTHVQAIAGRPFLFNFDLLTSFPKKNGYCAVLASTHDPFEIYNLQRKFVSRFEGIVRAGNLTPHMTLLYTDTFVERQAIAAIRWQAKEFVLIHSFVGEGRQEILGRWPLR